MLTDQDAIEILDNLNAFTNLLMNWDKKYNKRDELDNFKR